MKKDEGGSHDATSLSTTHGDMRDANKEETINTGTHETPAYAYDRKLESKIRLKIDLCVIPLAALIFLFCFIDRSNIGNARLAGLEDDLGLSGYDFNSVNTVFYISYIVFEIPSNILCKIVGPGWYLPGLTILFGLLVR